MQKTSLSTITSTALILIALGLGGCSSAPETRDLMAEEARSGKVERPVAMKGEATFASGKLEVVATVARGFTRVGKGKAPKMEKHSRWTKKDTDAFSEDYDFRAGDSDEEQKEAYKSYVRQAMARRAAGSPMPPVTLQVTFENHGSEPLEITPRDVNSDLGNFAVRPAKLTVAPGETGTLEPMISQLGVTNDVIPLTVSLRVNNGKPETQVIQVKSIFSQAVINQANAELK
jgi:hypothetical protein